MKPIKPYGNAGTLVLPWQDFSVPLYYDLKGQAGQDLVDKEDCAILQNNIDGGKVTFIGDHASQGFYIIQELGYGMPVVIQAPGCSRTYKWTCSMIGKNTGKYYIGIDGQNIKNVKWADLCLICCNDSAPNGITMVYCKFDHQDNFELYEVEGQQVAVDFDKYLYSTGTHYISNSGSDENGGYTGGRAGDQTGKEWCLKGWYNRPWTVVLRYPNQTVALKIAQLGIAAALNDRIGYDQTQRTTYWQRLKEAGYDPSKITVVCEEDCTAGVSANVRAAGYLCGIKALQEVPICTSRNMKAEFTKAGFQALTASKYLTSSKYLLPGDILLYENHHAATNVTLGSAVKSDWHPGEIPVVPDEGDDAPITPSEDVKGPFVEVTGNVHVRKGPSTDFDSIGVAKTGDKLHYFGYTYPENGWLLVEYDKQTAWVSGKYAEVVK